MPANSSTEYAIGNIDESNARVLQNVHEVEVNGRTGPYSAPADNPPPRISDFATMAPWPMSLDDAVRIALENSPVIRDAGGRALTAPESVRTTYDSALRTSDPGFGPDAALAAFDTQVESGLFWNGGGSPITSAFSTGTLGVFSQPTTMAKVGLSRRFITGTKVGFGGIGGYDTTYINGPYLVIGGDIRQPLLRGAGADNNRIAGPFGALGGYRGMWIAQIDANKSQLDLEQAVRDLVREVSHTYWELHFAYRNFETYRTALDTARQTWEREQRRVSEQAGRPDAEGLAKQQYFSADAAVQNAICGTGPTSTGIYNLETKLRTLLALPTSDGRLIRPTDVPLHADFRFDWNESLQMAQTRRVELRKQMAALEQRNLELKAARNLRWPQFDAVGTFRQLGGTADPSATFTQALNGWQLGVEYRQALGNRAENAAIRHADLRLCREKALLNEARRQVAAELRSAFTELDRSYGVTQSLAVSREAARSQLQAESERHAAGETDIERVLFSQQRVVQAETAFERSLVDYNHAFIKVHYVRNSLLDTLGVGVSDHPNANEFQFERHAPSLYSSPTDVLPAPEESVPAPTPSAANNAQPLSPPK